MIALAVIAGLITFVLCIGVYIGMAFTERYVWRRFGIDIAHDRPTRHRALAQLSGPRSVP